MCLRKDLKKVLELGGTNEYPKGTDHVTSSFPYLRDEFGNCLKVTQKCTRKESVRALRVLIRKAEQHQKSKQKPRSEGGC